MEHGSRNQNLEAFEALYNEYRLQVLAYCTRRIDRSVASDACSENLPGGMAKSRRRPGPT